MIITRIFGGLGNQLFQYAVGRSLSLRLGVPLKLDTRKFLHYKLRVFDLHHFAIDAPEASPSEITSLWHRIPGDRFAYRLGWAKTRLYKEPSLRYQPNVLQLDDGHYLKGYWQSPRYFENDASTLRQDLDITTPPSPENVSWLGRIEDSNAFSIHIRRGDYASNPNVLKTLGLSSLDYYRRAIDYVAGQTAQPPVFFVFSDDPSWARENIITEFETHIVRHNDGEHAYEDLRLMRACKGHIIANSTFSWWGAWLNPDERKIVVAPKHWAVESSNDPVDIIPDSWIRL